MHPQTRRWHRPTWTFLRRHFHSWTPRWMRIQRPLLSKQYSDLIIIIILIIKTITPVISIITMITTPVWNATWWIQLSVARRQIRCRSVSRLIEIPPDLTFTITNRRSYRSTTTGHSLISTLIDQNRQYTLVVYYVIFLNPCHASF